jgi:hypothetical protein
MEWGNEVRGSPQAVYTYYAGNASDCNVKMKSHGAQEHGAMGKDQAGKEEEGSKWRGCRSARSASRQNQVVFRKIWGINPIDPPKILH